MESLAIKQPVLPGDHGCPKPNAFRKFGDVVRFPLYSSPGIGTYAGNADPFPRTRPAIAAGQSATRTDERSSWISRGVGAAGRPSLGAAAAAPSRAQASRPLDRSAAGADLSCHEWGRHSGRALFPAVWRSVGRQLLVGSARAAAVGDLCRSDAADIATARHASPASRRLLAGRAVAGPPWPPIYAAPPAREPLRRAP